MLKCVVRAPMNDGQAAKHCVARVAAYPHCSEMCKNVQKVCPVLFGEKRLEKIKHISLTKRVKNT